MKKNHTRGFTIIELIIALVIISVILLVIVPAGQKATDNSRIANAVASIKAIQTAAVGWANDNGGQYTGLTFTNLTNGYLPAQFTSTATNPWNGNYSVNVNTDDPSKFDIALTNVPSASATKLTTAMTKLTEIAPTYTASSQTWSTTLQ